MARYKVQRFKKVCFFRQNVVVKKNWAKSKRSKKNWEQRFDFAQFGMDSHNLGGKGQQILALGINLEKRNIYFMMNHTIISAFVT